jgi:hypothetical protein
MYNKKKLFMTFKISCGVVPLFGETVPLTWMESKHTVYSQQFLILPENFPRGCPFDMDEV